MEHWDLHSLGIEPHRPQILHSTRGEARSIAIHLPAGERLQDHEVHERAHLVVIDGEVEIEAARLAPCAAAPGSSPSSIPRERHEVRAAGDARLLLVLAPWPGDGHPGARDA